MTSPLGLGQQFTVPGYRLVRPVADGGMGRVFLAEHLGSGLNVAVKLVDAETIAASDAGRRMANEARLLSRVNHPHVVTVYDHGSLEDGAEYQVMEYIRGEQLASLMQRRVRFTALDLLPFVKQIGLALHAVHAAGIVHRDLKPQNIVVTSERPLSLKVIDFGIALDLEEGLTEAAKSHTVLGTPLFISPEQLRLDRNVGPAADMYSLGAMLYWMLAGRPPFIGETLVQLLAAHLMQREPSLLDVAPRVPPAVAALVHCCLAKSPDDRPNDALLFAKAFAEAALEEQGTDVARRAFETSPGWASFPQLAETQPDAEIDDEVTAISDPLPWLGSLDGAALASAEYSAPTLVSPSSVFEEIDEELTRELTLVQSLESVLGIPDAEVTRQVDLELHMASTMILVARSQQKRSRGRWLNRLLRR